MTSTPIESLDDLLDRVCAKFCGECGEPLDPPGAQCAGCGVLPDETREEARERVAGEPDPVARAEAKRLREEAAQYLVAAEQRFRAADGVEHRSRLRRERDEAQVRLEEAAGAHERALSVLAGAGKAEEEAAGPLADAFANHERAVRAEETARRLRKPAADQTEALVRLQAAGQVLARCRGEAAAAARAREAAEEAAAQAGQAVSDGERERDAAQVLLDRHAAVPLTRVTVLALVLPLLRMARGHDIDGRPLDRAERAMVGVAGDGLHGAAFAEYAGALDRAEQERVRKQLREESQHAPHLRNVGDGRLEVSWAEPPKPDGAPLAGGVTTAAPRLTPAGPLRPVPEGLPGLRR